MFAWARSVKESGNAGEAVASETHHTEFTVIQQNSDAVERHAYLPTVLT